MPVNNQQKVFFLIIKRRHVAHGVPISNKENLSGGLAWVTLIG